MGNVRRKAWVIVHGVVAAALFGLLVFCAPAGDRGGGESETPSTIGKTTQELKPCSGSVSSLPYSFPLHHSWEAWDQSYMDSQMGLPEYPSGGVMYDYNRPDGSLPEAPPNGLPAMLGWRDYMGGDNTYDVHNGYDSSLAPRRVHQEGIGEVHPIAPGVVDEVVFDVTKSSEDIVTVRHANGYVSRYVHLGTGSARVRAGDQVTPESVLATLGMANAHLHLSFHDCDYQDSGVYAGEPSYYELFRADRRLWRRAPFYESGPSDVFEVQLRKSTIVPLESDSDDLRYELGQPMMITAFGQWRENDVVEMEIVTPFDIPFPLAPLDPNESWTAPVGRWHRFVLHSGYIFLGGGQAPPGEWFVRVRVNGVERARKYFHVDENGPNTNGPVQGTPSIVSLASGERQVAFYRGPDSRLKMRRWTITDGWGADVDLGGALAGSPSCVARGQLVDCFATSTGGGVLRWSSNDSAQSGSFVPLTVPFPAFVNPSAVSAGANHLDVILRVNVNGTVTLGRLSGPNLAFAQLGPYTQGSPLSCVAVTVANGRCYSRAPSGALFEVAIDNGIVTNAGPVNGSPNVVTVANGGDVTAMLLPGDGMSLANRIDITSRDGTSQMVRQTRLAYTNNTVRWLPPQNVSATVLSSVPSCTARPGATVYDCYAADQDRRLVIDSWTGTRWTGWHPVALSQMDQPGAPSTVSTQPDRLDVFFSDQPFRIRQRSSGGGVWNVPDTLNEQHQFGPGCVARNSNTVDCFTVLPGGSVRRWTRVGLLWDPPTFVPASFATSQVSPVLRQNGVLDIFYRGATGTLRRNSFFNGLWQGETDFGAPTPGVPFLDSPGCVERPGTTLVECFVRDAPNRLMTRPIAAGIGWSAVPIVAPHSAPAAIGNGTNAVAVFYRGRDNTLRTLPITAGVPGVEEILAGSISSAPACVGRTAPTRIDCFARGFENAKEDVLQYRFQASIGWQPPRSRASALTNLALNKPASQSSTYNGASASRAVDGNLTSTYSGGSVSHTQDDDNGGIFAWWQVDLTESRYVDHVQVFNRTDSCCIQRLDGFIVEVRNNTFEPWQPIDTTLTQQYTNEDGSDAGVVVMNRTAPAYPGVAISLRRTARYVRIRLDHKDYLHLAEVMVMGREH